MSNANEDGLSKLSARQPAEAYRYFKIELQDEAVGLLPDDPTPSQFLRLLIEQGYYRDAIQYLAHALPKRDAVWWACLCARSAPGDSLSPESITALEAAETWVRNPSEDHRRAAMAAAEGTDLDTTASLAAIAAFLSGGSIAPPDHEEIPPAEALTGKMVSAAIMLAAISPEPEKAQERSRVFLSQGIYIASGGLASTSPMERGAPAS